MNIFKHILKMSDTLKKRLDPKVLWFLCIGGFNTLIGIGLFPLVYWVFYDYRAHYLWMLIICHVVAVLNSYLTNKYFVFRTRGYNASEVLKFIFFHLSYFLVVIPLIPIFVTRLHMHPVVVQFCTCLLVVVCSFFWYDKIVFLPKKSIKLRE